MAKAPNVLILGGGTVGVELAAEIAWRFGGKGKGKQVRGCVKVYRGLNGGMECSGGSARKIIHNHHRRHSFHHTNMYIYVYSSCW